ncbi:hypothetical protein [Alkalilimnicola ehrlichii]|uniref:hypothetical protein n=1 Tax=Alkalilimnicola ehrlichii TaxID=351052 RepID=UPI003BA25B57
MREALTDLQDVDEILWTTFEGFRSRAVASRPYFDPLCDWLQEQVFPGRKLTNSSLELTRRLRADFIFQQLAVEERALLGRHDADEYWPQGPSVMQLADSGLLRDEFRYAGLTGFQRPVRCAPFVAAAIALGAREYELPQAALVYELRTLRGFDSEWFDTAYAQSLALGLAQNEGEEAL